MSHYVLGVIAWSGLAFIAGVATHRSFAEKAAALRAADCCAAGHPEAGPDDDMLDVGLGLLTPETSPMRLVSRPPVQTPGPATRPIAAVRPVGAL